MAVDTIAHHELDRVSVGVDTHRDNHVAAVKDGRGRTVATTSVAATPAGYRQLLGWAASFGTVELWGIEGTGSYGAGLSRFLQAAGQPVREVARPDRSTRRNKGKSDTIDAVAAARSVQSGEAQAMAKSGAGSIEAIRCLRVARGSAIKARTKAINTLKALVVTAPAELREQLRALSTPALTATCSRFRPGELTGGQAAIKLAMRCLARRINDLDAEVALLDAELDPLTQAAAPELRALPGVGADVAGQLLVTAGDNPERLRSEESFARLCGVAPLEASSGQTKRHRLNRGGDRQANRVLYVVVLVRLRHDARTRAYMARRIAEGKSKKEVIRCLKRYVAREVFQVLTASA